MKLKSIGILLLAVLISTSFASGKKAEKKKEIGLQLYSLRDDIKTDVPGILKR